MRLPRMAAAAARHLVVAGVLALALAGGGACSSDDAARAPAGDGGPSCTGAADGTPCGTGVCSQGACVQPTCTDGNSQCDDGALQNLDGCDSACRFEHTHRVIKLLMQFATVENCPKNALGSAITAPARSQIQGSIDASIADGSLSAILKLSGDPTGAAGDVTAGTLSATPLAGAGYSGTADVDWWYTPVPTTIDAQRNPLATMTGTFANGGVTLRGVADLTMSIGGSPALLHLSDATLTGAVGALSTPKASTGAPPGHLASLRLRPALQTFETLGGPASAANGELCGNVSARSLADAAMPASLRPGGSTPCEEGFTEENRVIDLFVHGCKAKLFGVPIPVVDPTQPDVADASKPVLGAGPPYKLTVEPTKKRVDACRDRSDAVVPLEACLDAAAYSSYFVLATNRVIVK